MRKFIICLISLICFSSLFCNTWAQAYEDFYNREEAIFYKDQYTFNCRKGSREWQLAREYIKKSRNDRVPRRHEKKCDTILNGLYIGGYSSVEYCVKNNLVDRIVSFNVDKKHLIPKKFKGKVLRIRKHDSHNTNIGQVFRQAYGFMKDSKKGVLVHCAKGHSRSASICILYIMFRFDVSYQEAKHFVQIKRPTTHPNSSFCQQMDDINFYRTER